MPEGNMAVRSYRDLISWQKAFELSEGAYRLTQNFPCEEKYGLAAQIRKSAVSVASNIAEGQGRRSVTDFLHFLSMARGSLNELETQLLIAQSLGFGGAERLAALLALADETGRVLRGLATSLETKTPS